MTTAEAIATDIEEYTRDELAKVATVVFSTVNKRIQRLIDSDTISPAYEALLRKRDTHFSVGGKDRKDLVREYSEAVAFYNMTTGTVTGARAFTNNLKAKIGERVNDKEYINKVFDLLHGVEERLPVYLANNMIGTNEILDNIIESNVDWSSYSMDADADAREDEINAQIDAIIEQVQGEIEDLQKSIPDTVSTWLF